MPPSSDPSQSPLATAAGGGPDFSKSAESAYARVGASSSKDDVHRATAGLARGVVPGAFAHLLPDVWTGDPNWCVALHADGAGTKAIVAYLHYRETGDPRIFRSIAQDALVMNLDDLACAGATGPFVVSNTVGRHRGLVPEEVLAELFAGYREFSERMNSLGFEIHLAGGETADLGDQVRTIVVDATVATRIRRDRVVDNARIQPGDWIVGFSSTGQAHYEDSPNSGIGSNGLTLARHVLLGSDYRERYPETCDPGLDPEVAYRGNYRLEDRLAMLGMTIGEALLSPTRTYLPILGEVLEKLGPEVHGLVHNTGGGVTKCQRFGNGVAFVKDDLFPLPPLMEILLAEGRIPYAELARTFNMGHRLEVYVPGPGAAEVIAIAENHGVAARVVGRVVSGRQTLTTIGPWGTTAFPPPVT